MVGKVRWRLLITTSSSPFNLFMHKRFRSSSGEYFCAIEIHWFCLFVRMSVLAAICLFCRPCVRLSLPTTYESHKVRIGSRDNVGVLFCFLKTFEEGGGGRFGHRKSMSLETHLLTITEQAMQVTHIGSECRGCLGNK